MDAVDAIGGRIQSLYNPGQSLEPLRQGARSAVNQRYAGLSDAVAAKTMSHGAKSGQFGGGVLKGELARLGDLGQVDTDYAKLALDQQSQGDALAMGLLGQNFGSSYSSSDSGDRTTTGEGVDAGDPLAAALGGGASSAANLYRLLMLDGMMRGNQPQG
jgi:hypothetical protein